jgi:hypothetical protein
MKAILIFSLILSSAMANALDFNGETARHLALGVETCGAFAFPDGADYSVETKDIVCTSRRSGQSYRYNCVLTVADENGTFRSIKPHEIDAKVLYDAMMEASLNKVCPSKGECAFKASQMKCMIFGVHSGDITYQCQVNL